MLKDKIILVGITGGIAAYKSAELVRLLVKEKAIVQAVMTSHAENFITPLTLRTLTGRPVYTSLFHPSYGSATIHIDLAREPHLVVVAPATANFLGKLAAGIADDLLSSVLLAVDLKRQPVILAPSMNTSMFHNPAVQDNIKLLRSRGYIFADPLSGPLACGEVGEGRMVEPTQLLQLIKDKLSARRDYKGLTVLVTAGPTREPLDPVRFISNHSSGRMGYAFARAAQERGARVLLISGPTSLEPPAGVEFYPVESAREMYNVVMEKFSFVDIIIKTAAVSDFRPEETFNQKIKKGGTLSVKLVQNPDILRELGLRKGNRFLVGFAAETEKLLENARKKLQEKNLDLIVANDLTEEGAGFIQETNKVALIYKEGKIEELPLLSKYELSHLILDRILGMVRGRNAAR